MASTKQNTQPTPQLLSVAGKDKKRLLEVYVKRSLSLNDGSQHPKRQEQKSGKWVTISEQNKRDRKHSSDTSLNLALQASISDEDIRTPESFPEPEVDKKLETLSDKKSKKWKIKGSLRRNDGSSASQKSKGKPKKWFAHTMDKDKEDGEQANGVLPSETSTNTPDQLESSTEQRKNKEDKKKKKTTVWKSFLSWLSGENSEKRQEEPPPPSEPLTHHITCLPLPETLSKNDISVRRSRSLKKKLSHKSLAKWRRSGDMGQLKSVELVEPTNSYYEKVSEELEKIVHAVKDSPAGDSANAQPTCLSDVKRERSSEISQEEVIRKITALIKHEGDLINCKLKENNTVTSFLDGFSYGNFKQLADQYVQSEVPNEKTHPPVAAPELVKFAFTLDFTARVANLHRQATGRIMGFGDQYLQDRFTHMSESHPHLSEVRTEGQKVTNFDQDFISL